MERHKPTVFSSSIRGYSLLEDALDVLLVEDSRSDAELIKLALGDRDKGCLPFRITVVSRLSDALSLLEAKVFDVAILDLNLPDSNGITSLICLNAAVTAYTPIIVYSGVANNEMQDEALSHGAYCCLSKSRATTSNLKDIIQEAMGYNNF